MYDGRAGNAASSPSPLAVRQAVWFRRNGAALPRAHGRERRGDSALAMVIPREGKSSAGQTKQ